MLLFCDLSRKLIVRYFVALGKTILTAYRVCLVCIRLLLQLNSCLGLAQFVECWSVDSL